jgi:N-methylhydantoinase A/oxoprolinase/acetone carboxylase beta subunit
LITCEEGIEYPILTLNSGPTNSLRGACELASEKTAIVVDIGGTTADLAFLDKGFPKETSAYVEVAGVRTNFRMPNVYSIGLGGGSIVTFHENG